MPQFQSRRDAPAPHQHTLNTSLSRKHVRTVAAASLLAITSLSGIAFAEDLSGDDGDLRSEACGAIGCADGGRECARAVVTTHTWAWVPLPPWFFPVPIPIDRQQVFTCYEGLMK